MLIPGAKNDDSPECECVSRIREHEVRRSRVDTQSCECPQVVMACGASTGAKTDKVAANNIEMMAVEGSDIQIPADTRLAMVATLQQSVEVGDHILHICQVDKFLGNEDKKGLYAWNGFGKVAPAAEG